MIRRLRLLVFTLAILAIFKSAWFAWGWRFWPRVEEFASPPPSTDTPRFIALFHPEPQGTPPAPKAVSQALARDLRRITDKTALSPRHDPRDYVSLSIYWWPNPLTRLPYLPRDGRRNPEADDYDAPALQAMVNTVHLLASANNEQANARAVKWLRAWFITPETRMHPHLTFAQMMPGLAAGGRQGIIEGLPLATRLLDAVAWLDARDALTDSDRRELRRWLQDYLLWLTQSRPGHVESTRANNHGAWHDVQVAAIATALGMEGLARTTLERSRSRLATHFLPDGRQPEELRRTKSFDYSAYNLQAWMHLEKLALKHGLTCWNDGPAQALRYLEQHATDWPHPDITPDRAATLKALHRLHDSLRAPSQP